MSYFKIYAMKTFKRFLWFCLLAGFQQLHAQENVSWWLTTRDKSALLTRQVPLTIVARTGDSGAPVITINPSRLYQSIDGFGFALTGGSAQHIRAMSAANRHQLLQELFARNLPNVGISYLRLSIGSSDLNDHVFSYDDLPEGQTDTLLNHFDLGPDKEDVIPVLKEILAINPSIKILASPWSAPIWMKTNHNIQGGRLMEEYYGVYAKYFVRYITEMKKQGIVIDAVTLQNEPFNDGNTPSMQFFAKQEALFIKKQVGPLFKANGIATKIILYDHNCDAPEYPVSILTDPEARQYIDGSGFHLYAGPVTALTRVHQAFPEKNVYFTEMMAVNRNNDFNITNPVDRILIGATRNWSRNVILWNLAANSANQPHTDNGGCAMCQGAITIDGDTVERNIAYYVIGHASAFVPQGSVRIESSVSSALSSVAFKTPDHKIVVIVANKSNSAQTFIMSTGDKSVTPTLPAGSVATFVW
jgi:glucosylceramidase